LNTTIGLRRKLTHPSTSLPDGDRTLEVFGVFLRARKETEKSSEASPTAAARETMQSPRPETRSTTETGLHESDATAVPPPPPSSQTEASQRAGRELSVWPITAPITTPDQHGSSTLSTSLVSENRRLDKAVA